MKQVARVLGKSWIPVAAILVALLVWTSPASFGKAAALQLAGWGVDSAVVSAEIRNADAETRTGTLTVGATVDGVLLVTSTPVSVSGGQTARVSVAFPSPVDEIIVLGIRDEDVPF